VAKLPNRSRDPNQLAKLIADIATGEVVSTDVRTNHDHNGGTQQLIISN
jgi:hypothetical protein